MLPVGQTLLYHCVGRNNGYCLNASPLEEPGTKTV